MSVQVLASALPVGNRLDTTQPSSTAFGDTWAAVKGSMAAQATVLLKASVGVNLSPTAPSMFLIFR